MKKIIILIIEHADIMLIVRWGTSNGVGGDAAGGEMI